MTIVPLRFVADMNISPLTVNVLAAEGMDIVRVSSLLPVNASDESILSLAREQKRVVITQDTDFSALLALGGHDQPSLVTLRLLNTDPDVVTERLRQVLPQIESALRRGCAVTVEDRAVRVRQLPIR
jgi:predicted nuclease of predicted toxin-antitoxin system